MAKEISAPAEKALFGRRDLFCPTPRYPCRVANPFDENLTDGAINTPFLTLESQQYFGNANPPDQYLLTTADAYWLNWQRPDVNYNLVVKTNLSSASWKDFTNGTILTGDDQRFLKIAKADLPSSTYAFFALQQRTNSQIQILLPGETAAPNTPTGKTGTPTNVSLGGGGGVVDPIIVRAVDNNFNLVTGVTDTIQMVSSTDGAATLQANVTIKKIKTKWN